MNYALQGLSVEKAHELIKSLAKEQIKMEKGHYDTLKTILRYCKKKYPKEADIKYSTAQFWLASERNKILLKSIDKK